MSDIVEEVSYSPSQIAAAVRATYGVFICLGFAFASWASRIPQVRDHLHLTPAGLGLVLLSIAAGSIIALPLSGAIVHRLHPRRTVTLMALVLAVGMAITGLGYLLGVATAVVGLFVVGFANGAWDVAMNVHGAEAERHLGKAIMPRFHAGFSLGTVIGALLGAAMVALKVPVTAHFELVAAIVALRVPVLARRFLPDPASPAAALPIDAAPIYPAANGRGLLSRWGETRTLLIGVTVLAFAFAEGAGNDWISIALIDGHHTAAPVGTLGYAVFLAAMTTARWFGSTLLDRHGRVVAIRGLSVVALIGLMLFVFGPTPIAFVGAVLWGAGVSLGFPVGMSAAADEPAAAAGRVSVVASIGYCAFLGGPPLIGFLGSRVGTLHAISAVAVLLAVATMLAGTLRPLQVTVR